MFDPSSLIPVAAALLALLIAIVASLRGWQGWLALKRAELEARNAPLADDPSPASRIELADLKARVRRLEAIASGVE
jgi:hypothetical protein